MWTYFPTALEITDMKDLQIYILSSSKISATTRILFYLWKATLSDLPLYLSIFENISSMNYKVYEYISWMQWFFTNFFEMVIYYYILIDLEAYINSSLATYLVLPKLPSSPVSYYTYLGFLLVRFVKKIIFFVLIFLKLKYAENYLSLLKMIS